MLFEVIPINFKVCADVIAHDVQPGFIVTNRIDSEMLHEIQDEITFQILNPECPDIF
jgi:hypothetical protein